MASCKKTAAEKPLLNFFTFDFAPEGHRDMEAREILEHTKCLSAKEKALVARCLLASLDARPGEEEEAVAQAWFSLAQERFDELMDGKAEPCSWKEIRNAITAQGE